MSRTRTRTETIRTLPMGGMIADVPGSPGWAVLWVGTGAPMLHLVGDDWMTPVTNPDYHHDGTGWGARQAMAAFLADAQSHERKEA